MFLRMGYAQDKEAYRSAVRAKDPLLCPQRAIAAMLVERHTFEGVEFPDPRNMQEWCGLAVLQYTSLIPRRIARVLSYFLMVLKRRF